MKDLQIKKSKKLTPSLSRVCGLASYFENGYLGAGGKMGKRQLFKKNLFARDPENGLTGSRVV
jgi:hypothetical protein